MYKQSPWIHSLPQSHTLGSSPNATPPHANIFPHTCFLIPDSRPDGTHNMVIGRRGIQIGWSWAIQPLYNTKSSVIGSIRRLFWINWKSRLHLLLWISCIFGSYSVEMASNMSSSSSSQGLSSSSVINICFQSSGPWGDSNFQPTWWWSSVLKTWSEKRQCLLSDTKSYFNYQSPSSPLPFFLFIFFLDWISSSLIHRQSETQDLIEIETHTHKG